MIAAGTQGAERQVRPPDVSREELDRIAREADQAVTREAAEDSEDDAKREA